MGEAVDRVRAKLHRGEVVLSSDAAQARGNGLLLELAAANISQEQRDKWAKEGVAMRDGSWPIPDADFLQRAITSFGRGDKANSTVKAHIKKRAKALGLESRLPDEWK